LSQARSAFKFGVPVHSVAFPIFGFQIYWYGILAALGFLFAFGTGSRRAPRAGLKGEDVYNLAPWIIVGTVIGARLLYVITFWDKEFAGEPLVRIFNVRSGLVYYGGLVGASLGTILFTWKSKLPLWRLSDVMAPSIPLGHAFGRVGCFMTGCCYGRACHLPWAVHFPPDHWTHGNPVHPVQLYESALNFMFYAFLAWLFQRRKFDGQVFAVYLMGYAIIRTFTESFRGDYAQQHIGGVLTPGQSVSIIIFILGVALWVWQSRTRVRAPAAA
jgi:phosphatidylglycerol:prolipoprotein diacylglycerol transferase